MAVVLCLGDSITDCGSFLPEHPLGYGYVKMLSDKLQLEQMQGEWRLYNRGFDGFTLERTMQKTPDYCSLLKPEVITLLIGINDVGLMMNTNRTENQKEKMMERFLQNYESLLQIFAEKNARVILMEPFIFSRPAVYSNWIPYVKAMAEGIAQLAEKYEYSDLKLQELLDEKVRECGLDFVTTDGIHLTPAGHRIISEKLYDCIFIHTTV